MNRRQPNIVCWSSPNAKMKALYWAPITLVASAIFLTSHLASSQNNQNLNQKTCYGTGNNGFQSWTDYYTMWYETYPSYAKVLFPFGMRFCDTNATSTQKANGFNLHVQQKFPYYGSEYVTLWVTPSGTIVFNNSLNFQGSPPYFSSRTWPNPQYPLGGSLDLPFAAPFLAQADPRYGMMYEPSQVSYRIINTSVAVPPNQQLVMEGMLNYVSLQVRAATPGSEWFKATYGVIVTWYKFCFQGCTCPNSDSPNTLDHCPRNTYQAAIVTDGIKTYTVFNYYNITWVGASTSPQDCSPVTGLASSAYPNCQPAIIGFNAGEARGFTSFPYSNTSQVGNMDKLSGSNVTGRWIYDVTGNLIRHGGCTNDTTLGATVWPLEMWPTYGPMLGGVVVNVTGPCFMGGDRFKCKFGDTVVDGIYWGNMMQAMCIAPRLNMIGDLNLSVSVDGGYNYYFSNKYLVDMDSRIPRELNVSISPVGDWINTNQITLYWNAKNLTVRDNDRVTISLWGYKEIGNYGTFMQNHWQRIYTYQFDYSNTGVYSFYPAQTPCSSQQPSDVCSSYTMGAFTVSLSLTNPFNPRQYWSEIVPLGWFAKAALGHNHGGSWAARFCTAWYQEDSLSSSWKNYVPACPCKLQQAYVDYGSFLPDEECNLGNYQQAGSCVRHKGAVACYTSVNVTSTGAGMTCCYNTNGYLAYSGDTQYGSLAARSHPWGKPPYGTPPYVPVLSHWFHDIMPWYFCCQWQIGGKSDWNQYDCFNRYMPMRPTGDCVNYKPPGFAMSFGDPHFRTFDETNYTFNSWGEFWLVDIHNAPVVGGFASFSLQGRYQQPANQTWGQIRATIMTAAAMQFNDGPIVSVQINQYDSQEELLVYVDSEVVNFTMRGQKWHEYQDFLIINNDPDDHVMYRNFSIIFRIGIGVQVAYANGLMQLMCTLPPLFKTKTNGLFGYWNGNPLNDLVPRQSGSNSGATPVQPSDTQTVHYSFGLTWVVMESESLFIYLYRAQLNYQWYHRTWFTPYFQATMPPNSTISTSQVQQTCGNNQPCQYDYMVAQNGTWALDTYNIQKWDAQQRFNGRYIPACGWLDAPNSIKQEPVCYTVGCEVTITGCRPKYYMYRNIPKTYTCQQQGTCSPVSSSTEGCSAFWSPTLSEACVWQPVPPGQMAAIIIPISLAIIGVIVAIVVCVMIRRKREHKAEREAALRQPAMNLDKIAENRSTPPSTTDRSGSNVYPYPMKPGGSVQNVMYAAPPSRRSSANSSNSGAGDLGPSAVMGASSLHSSHVSLGSNGQAVQYQPGYTSRQMSGPLEQGAGPGVGILVLNPPPNARQAEQARAYYQQTYGAQTGQAAGMTDV